MAGWSTCRSCHQRIWWGTAPFDDNKAWPYDDDQAQSQHRMTCPAADSVTDAVGTRHEVSRCRACGTRVWWDTTPRGKRRPMDCRDAEATWTCHFDTCPGEPVAAGTRQRPPETELDRPLDIDLWLGELGLAWPATLEDVTRAFRGLARRHHPDMGGDARL